MFQKAKTLPAVLLSLMMGFGGAVCAQVSEDSLMRDEDPEAVILAELEKKKEKKKDDKKQLKQPKNEFYGIKTKKNFIKTYGNNGTGIEIFNHVQVYQDPNPYLQNVQEADWFDPNKRAIIKTPGVDKKEMRLLHGPYQKVRDGNVIAEGFYYLGGKHGRWESYDEDYKLKNKEKYYRGWAKDAEMTYWDTDRKKIKEYVPVHYGEKHGMSYAFYEGGQIHTRGKYEHNHRVGIWSEYYQFSRYSRSKKKEIRYPKRAFDKTEPVTIKEWDEKGKISYDRDRDGEKAEAETGTEEENEKF